MPSRYHICSASGHALHGCFATHSPDLHSLALRAAHICYMILIQLSIVVTIVITIAFTIMTNPAHAVTERSACGGRRGHPHTPHTALARLSVSVSVRPRSSVVSPARPGRLDLTWLEPWAVCQ